LPLVGRLVSKYDPRLLIAFGFAVLSLSLFHMAYTIYPGIDFRTATMLRVYQSVGMAFLFVPINTVAYAGVPSSKNNQVAGIVNLARNMGGDIGIALVTTLIARRSQVHQANLASHLDAGNNSLTARVAGISRALEHVGSSSVEATRQAYGLIYRQLIQQAQTLAYQDVLFILGCFTAAMIPTVVLARRVRGGRTASAH
jgi:DHA2 family multidrug resistance protein